MANRRIYPLVSTPWHQNIKMNVFKNRQILNQCSNYTCQMTKVSFRPQTEDKYIIKSWAKFETENFDGINLIAALYKRAKLKASASCVFRVYAISVDSLWNETLITTVNGTLMPDGKLKASISEATFGSLYLDGEVTLRVEVDVVRQNKTFKEMFYLNHVGIYGNVFLLRKDVKFLELTKLDE